MVLLKKHNPRTLSTKRLKVKDDVINFLWRRMKTKMCLDKDYFESNDNKMKQKRVM